MVKRKYKKKVVGSNNIVRTAIPKEMEAWIIEFKIEMDSKSKKPNSKQWAALQLTRTYRGKKK